MSTQQNVQRTLNERKTCMKRTLETCFKRMDRAPYRHTFSVLVLKKFCIILAFWKKGTLNAWSWWYDKHAFYYPLKSLIHVFIHFTSLGSNEFFSKRTFHTRSGKRAFQNAILRTLRDVGNTHVNEHTLKCHKNEYSFGLDLLNCHAKFRGDTTSRSREKDVWIGYFW